MGNNEEDSLIAAATNLMFIAHYEHEIAAGRLPASLQDMPFYEQRDSLGILPDVVRFPVEPVAVEKTWHVLKQTKHPDPKAFEVFPTLYITGPMRGKPGLNWAAFDSATTSLRTAGFNVISPAHEDRLRGIDPKDYENTKEVSEQLLRGIVRDDLAIVQALRPEYGDGLALLEGWGRSTGATAEVHVAEWLNLRTKFVEDWIEDKNNG